MTALKLKTEMALRGLVFCEHHHARCCHIQPVNGERVRAGFTQSRFDAVRLRLSGNGQHASGLFDEDEILIFPQYFNGLRDQRRSAITSSPSSRKPISPRRSASASSPNTSLRQPFSAGTSALS